MASKAGFGRRDLTPDLGRRIAGYSLCSPNAQGVLGRLEASALVFELSGELLALVSIDLLAGSRWVATKVAERLGWPLDRVLVAGTHTHAGPSGVFATGYDDLTSHHTGFDDFAAERAVDAAHTAVLDALASRRAAVVGFGRARVVGALWNRSSRATLWNRTPGEAGFGQDPDGWDAPGPGRERRVATWITGHDPGPLPAIPPWAHEGGSFAEFLATLTTQPLGACVGQNGPLEQAKEAERALAWDEAQVVWAEQPDGAPIGAFVLPPGTPAVLGFRYELFGPDVHGLVRRRLPWPAAIGGGVVGDVNVVPPDQTADQLRAARGDYDTVLPSLRSAAAALATAIEGAVADARTGLRGDLRVATALRHPTVASAPFVDLRLQPRELSDEAHVGPETLRGSELAPGAKMLPRFGPASPFDAADPQSPKRRWPLSKVAAPATTRVQLVRFTDPLGAPIAGIVAASTELSSGLARTMTDALAPSLGRVFLASPAGDYLSYASTPAEYRAQEYETSSVVYGRFTGEWLLVVVRGLLPKTGLVGPVTPLAPHPKVPDYDGPGAVPLPSARFERFRGEGPAHGVEATVTADGGLRIAGWFTPVAHAARAPVPPGVPLFRLTDGTRTVDEIGAVGLCARIGGTKHRWAFQVDLAAADAFPAGSVVRFLWSGSSQDRPRSAVPPVTIPAAGTARATSG